MRALALVLTASLVVSLPALALAQEPPPPEAAPPSAPMPPPAAAPAAPGQLGGVGQFAISVDLPFMNSAPQLAIIHESQSMGGPSATTFTIAPALDYFVIPNLSIGGQLGVARTSQSIGGVDVTATAFVVGARIGYNLPISDALSIWPRASFAYAHGSGDAMGTSVTTSQTQVVVEAPVLYHPAPHFFFGLGPVFVTQLSNSIEAAGTSMDQAKTTDIGLEAMVGGYFGGT